MSLSVQLEDLLKCAMTKSTMPMQQFDLARTEELAATADLPVCLLQLHFDASVAKLRKFVKCDLAIIE